MQNDFSTEITQNLCPSITTHLIKYEDLNHHRTLYAGRVSEWLVETCFISAARVTGKPADVVCVQVHHINFLQPGRVGDLLEIRSIIGHVGQKSLTIIAEGTVNGHPEAVVFGVATFVTVDEDGKSYAHGITLTDSYKQENSRICAKAEEYYNNSRT